MPRSVILLALVGVAATAAFHMGPGPSRWSSDEVEELRTLSIAALESPPPDPSNRVAEHTLAAALGHKLFFDPRFSSNGAVSCATCHRPELGFQDGVPLAVGVGVTDRRTMPIAGVARSPFQFWDGRKDTPWAQALGPLESPVEHGGSRLQYVHVLAQHYAQEYAAVFGPLPDLEGLPARGGPVPDPDLRAAWDGIPEEQRVAVTRAFANMGKAIAAYERRIDAGPTRFDAYVASLSSDGRAAAGILTPDEEAGLRVFLGKGNCTQCHNGPLLTNFDFHNTGVPPASGRTPDRGRAAGAGAVLADEFNCRSPYSDAPAGACADLEYMVADGAHLEGAFKVPSLRGVAERAPFMHAGQFPDLDAVVAHYRRAPRAATGTTELRRLRLSDREARQLVAFLRTLSAPPAAPAGFLHPPTLPGFTGPEGP